MTFTDKQLKQRGFAYITWTDEGETFTEYVLQKGSVKIEISGISLIEVAINNEYATVQVESLEELDTLIKVLGLWNY